MDKVLTVIVPVYNMEKYIRQCLGSLVIGEVLERIEVLVVLDGSKDGSAGIAYEFVERYPDTFRIIYKANGGHGSAINTGLMMASGEYVKILDSDDWVDRDAFCRLVDCLETGEADVVWSNYYWVYEMNGEKAIQYRDPFPDVVYGKKYRFEDIADRTFIKMHSMTIRTELARQAGRKIDENCYYVDVEFVMYPITEVETIIFLDEFVYMYRLGRSGQSMSMEQMRRNHRNHEQVLKSLLAFYDEQKFRHLDQAHLDYLEKGIARVVSSHFKIYLSFPCSGKVFAMMKALDEKIREEYPDVYKKVENKVVWAIRRSGYLLYYPGHFCMSLKEKKA